MPHDEAAAVLPRKPNDLEALLMSAKRYVSAYWEDTKNHPQARDAALDLANKISEALTAGPRGDLVIPEDRLGLGQLVHDYYRGEIGRMMQQAEHWAEPDKELPLAVHHRLRKADEMFQVVAMFDPTRLNRGHKDPFTSMADQMASPFWSKDWGAYPPSVELHRYRDPRFVVERLDKLLAEGKNRG